MRNQRVATNPPWLAHQRPEVLPRRDGAWQGFTPRDFASEVQAGLFVGWLHKTVALIGERRVGRGRFLASTFRLSQHLATHPIAALMLRDMLGYLGRNAA